MANHVRSLDRLSPIRGIGPDAWLEGLAAQGKKKAGEEDGS